MIIHYVVVFISIPSIVVEALCTVSNPRVKLSIGEMEGLCMSDGPIPVDAFLSVPYGRPPIGQFRFMRSEIVSRWSGVIDTKQQPPRCTQETEDPYSEDCLYLNVFTPHTKNSSYPVLVIIHGGAFATGGARNQGTPQHISRNIVSRGVIVVVIQYRVGPLGFCTTGDDEMKGNYGLWDVTLALKWIKDHIGQFGGNPDSVTLYGGSAGSVIVDLLNLSPHSNSLFHRMIMFSGGSRDFWNSPVKKNCVARAKKIGLKWNNTHQLKQQFMKASFQDLKGGWQNIGENAFVSLTQDWAPRWDGEFFPHDRLILRKEAPNKPVIMGVAELEGAAFSSKINMNEETLDKIIHNMVPESTPNRIEIIRNLTEWYLEEGRRAEPDAAVKNAVQAAFGERTVIATVRDQADKYLSIHGDDQSLFLYVFRYFNPLSAGSFYPFISKASHAFEQQYLLGANFKFSAIDEKVRDYYTKAITNFVKYGNPNGDGSSLTSLPIEWKPSTVSNRGANIVIDEIPFMSNDYFRGRPRLNNELGHAAGTIPQL